MSVMKIIMASAFIFTTSYVWALDTSTEEKTCSEIGFKIKTEAHGNCVLELLSRKSGKTSSGPDDATCKKYGFKPGTTNYSDCRLKIDLARLEAQQRQAQYDEQKRQYDAQVAAIQQEQARQRAMKQMELGLRMMGGQSLPDAAMATAGIPPPPKPPEPLNQTILMPGGRMVTCTTTGNLINCF